MAATSHDVARMAGVSQSTVSRALRGVAGMSEETRHRVLQAAAVLAYVPIEAGRSLSTRSTKRIGIVAADLTNPFYPELVEPVRAELDRLGYRALLIPDRSDALADIGPLADGSLDGVILTTALLGSPLPHNLAARRIPFVLANREVDGIEADTCVADNRLGATQVAGLIAGLGHRAVAAVFGPADTSTGRDRETGLREGLSEHGVALPAKMVRRGKFSHETGYAAALELLERPDRPTAIFCGNDVIAFGACDAAAACGITLGRDLTIVGFDDIAMAAWHVFRLTTVRCDLAELARAAISLLTRRIEDPLRPAERVVLPTELILRSTHGAALRPASR